VAQCKKKLASASYVTSRYIRATPPKGRMPVPDLGPRLAVAPHSWLFGGTRWKVVAIDAAATDDASL